MPIKAPKRGVGDKKVPKKGSWCQKKGLKKGCWCQGEEEMRRMYFNFIKSAITLKDIHFQKYLLQNITDWDTATVGSRLKGQFSAVQVVWFK